MTAVVEMAIPPSIDPTGSTDVSLTLNKWLATAKPGTRIVAPKGSPKYLLNGAVDPVTGLQYYGLMHKNVGVTWDFDGATFVQTMARPFGFLLAGCTIKNDPTYGSVLYMPRTVPPTCNYGYVDDTGNDAIKSGTEIILAPDRRSGILSNVVPDATGVTIQFTSKGDRGRTFITVTAAKDWQILPILLQGCNPLGQSVTVLEAQAVIDFNCGPGHADGINATGVFGDGVYYGASGAKPTTFVELTNSSFKKFGRSGIVTANGTDFSMGNVDFDRAPRSFWDIECNSPDDVIDRITIDKFTSAGHELQFMSSEGNALAHVGAINILNGQLSGAPMTMWLVGGTIGHRRGPYRVINNKNSWAHAFGNTYPAAAMILIDQCVGATIQGNDGVLQPGRFPAMCGVRYNAARCRTAPIVTGNNFVGGAEVGTF